MPQTTEASTWCARRSRWGRCRCGQIPARNKMTTVDSEKTEFMYIKSTNLRIFCWRRALIIILAWLLIYWVKHGIILGKSKSWLQGFAQQKVSLPEGKLKAREEKNNGLETPGLSDFSFSNLRWSSWMRLIAWPRPHNRQGTLVKIEIIAFFPAERLNQLRRDMQNYVDMMYVCSM